MCEAMTASGWVIGNEDLGMNDMDSKEPGCGDGALSSDGGNGPVIQQTRPGRAKNVGRRHQSSDTCGQVSGSRIVRRLQSEAPMTAGTFPAT